MSYAFSSAYSSSSYGMSNCGCGPSYGTHKPKRRHKFPKKPHFPKAYGQCAPKAFGGYNSYGGGHGFGARPAGFERIVGSPYGDNINLNGRPGHVLQNVYAGPGNDYVDSRFSHGERQVINLGPGNDRADFGGSNNLYNVFGHQGNDVVTASGVHNRGIITGDSGNDIANIGGRDNLINFHGGSGVDTANLSGLHNKVITTDTEIVNVGGKGNRIDVVNAESITLAPDASGNFIVTKGAKQPPIPAGFTKVGDRYVDTRSNTIVRTHPTTGQALV